jgi:Zn-dependent peptidase ImmA (M78 family)
LSFFRWSLVRIQEGPPCLDALSANDRRIEIACNRFAGEFLVPDFDFLQRADGLACTDDEIEDLARLYSVSREFMLRKLLDAGHVDQPDYDSRAARWEACSEAVKTRCSKPPSHLKEDQVLSDLQRYVNGLPSEGDSSLLREP